MASQVQTLAWPPKMAVCVGAVVLNLDRDRVLDEKPVSVEESAGGLYLSWDVTGPVSVRSIKTAGPDALITGIFVDAGRKGPRS